MTQQFNSLGAFAEHLATLAVAVGPRMHAGLDRAAAAVEARAKAEIGTYQPAVGPYPEWAELAESTQAERERLGFTPNDPLLRTGGLRDSIGRTVGTDQAVIGSTSETMVFHEVGTERMPPRPVLAPALIASEEEVKRALGSALFSAITPDGHRAEALP